MFMKSVFHMFLGGLAKIWKCWGVDIHEVNYLGESAEEFTDPSTTLLSLCDQCILSLGNSAAH
jgi:hypothetical protein